MTFESTLRNTLGFFALLLLLCLFLNEGKPPLLDEVTNITTSAIHFFGHTVQDAMPPAY